MAKHSSHIRALAKRGAVARLREQANELSVLLMAFPDLHDAFDADELPVSFIVKRDARRARAKASTQRQSMSTTPRRAARRRAMKDRAERRARHDK